MPLRKRGPWYRLAATAKRPGKPDEPFHLVISRAEPHPTFGWQLTVDCPTIHPEPLPVYGVEKSAVWDQACSFVLEALRDQGIRVVDKKGEPVELPKPDVGRWGLDEGEA